jgi:glycosyltransferase involved in cell wall biosynthesis
VHDLAVALKERGEKVTVLAGGGGALFDSLFKNGIECRLLKNMIHPINPFKDLQAFCEIKDILSEIKPDLVTTHSNKAGLVGRLAAKTLRLPVIHTSHGFLFGGREHSLPGYCYRFAEKIAAGAADRVICVSESEYRLALKLKVIKPDKLSMVYNGLPDIDSKYRAVPDREPPLLISVARFSEPKDHQSLLRALIGLTEIKWRLDLVGDGPKQKMIESLISNTPLAGKVNFLGMRSAVPELLAQSSIFILSSKREGFPISILEAMRAGLPVIASDVGGVSEAVIDGETGYLVPVGDHALMRKRICVLLEDPILRKNMGAKGRERFLQYFTLQKMVEKYWHLYREVVKQ